MPHSPANRDHALGSRRRALQEVLNWRSRAATATVEAVECCDHPVAELFEAAGFMSCASFLVCRACGYAEELGGAGTWRLTNTYNAPRVTRDAGWKLVTVFVTQDAMEGLGRYGAARATPNLSLRNFVRGL